MSIINNIFRAKVIDNNQFTLNGKIEVEVYGITIGDGVTKLAEVMTPYGGLPNMGMVAVPSPGTTGFVFFERADSGICVWMGSVLVATDNKYEDYSKEHDDQIARPVEVEEPQDFLIKTQNTTLRKQDLDDKVNRVENIIKMNKDEFTLAKINQSDDSYTYKKNAYDIGSIELPYQIISMTDDSIVIKYKPTNTSADNYVKLNLSSNGIDMECKTGNTSRIINIGADNVVIDSDGRSTVTISNDGIIKIDGDRIELGGNTKWGTLYEGFRDFVNNVFINHQHGTSSGGTIGKVIANPDTILAKSTKVKLS